MEEVKKLEIADILDQDGRLSKNISFLLKSYELKIKEIELKREEYKDAILKAMEESGVDKFEGDFVIINYIKPTTRDSFDSKKFKEDHPLFYEDYVKVSEVKSSIRIKVKEEKK